MVKKVKKYVPRFVLIWIRTQIERYKFAKAYLYDFRKNIKFSSAIRYDDTQLKLVSTIIRNYHVVEKGLTMPETRLGFGKDRINILCDDIILYIKKYGLDNDQIHHAIGVLLEYDHLHRQNNFILSDNIQSKINKLKQQIPVVEPTPQLIKTRNEYFKSVKSDFKEFSNSRASIRNFSTEEISVDKILNALELARNTPSACNRQTSRPYVYNNKEEIKEILQVQGGNRGFGHLANKLLIVTADLSVYNSVAERNQAFIDGGMYAMNVLYSLHHNEIAACILNCSHTPEKDKKLRKLCNIKESEVFIAMIACGIPPEKFNVAISKRHSLSAIVTVN